MTDNRQLVLDPILQEAFDCLPDGISIFKADGVPLVYNVRSRERFPHLFNAFNDGARSYREAIIESVRRVRPELDEDEIISVSDKLTWLADSGQTYEQHTHDGRIVLVTYRPMSEGRRVAISVDVTELRMREKELKKARAEALAASAAKSAFLANMSHEIRTPLNGIMGMAQVLDTAVADPVQREMVATIIDSSRTLLALLNDVLDLSKIEAGKFDIAPGDTDLHDLLRRQVKLWKPRAEEKQLNLSMSFDADLPRHMSIDAVRVQQCLSNLLSNAIKFTETGGVEVLVRPVDDAGEGVLIEIEVRDTGSGMDADTLARLFQPFEQADGTTQRRFGGTGLGLSITRRLAQLMGGDAVAESSEGDGSIFRLSFRGRRAHAPESRNPVQAAEPGDVRATLKQAGLRILLVDDHPINRKVAALFLAPVGVKVVEAANGLEAIAALEREPFDLMLLDMHMPEMDGPATIAHVRARPEPWSNLPVVALTADAMSGDRERYLALGMDGYLSKPLSERDLLTVIASLRAGRPAATAQPPAATAAG